MGFPSYQITTVLRRFILPSFLLIIPLAYVACSDSLPVAEKEDNSSNDKNETQESLCDAALVSRGGCISGVYLEASYYPDAILDWTKRPMDTLLMFTGFEQDGVQKNPVALAPLHLGRIDMGPEESVNGFPIAVGRNLRAPNGDPINYYFTQKIKTSLILPPSMSEGNYQIAIISDDIGQLSAVTPQGNYFASSKDVVTQDSHPGQHPVYMSCIAEPIYLKADSKVDITIEHANVMGAGGLLFIMRPYTASNQLCGQLVNAEFVETRIQAEPYTTYDYLAGLDAIRAADGWEVVPDEALMLGRDLAEELYPQQ